MLNNVSLLCLSSSECSSGSYGFKCAEKCRCDGDYLLGTCDHVNGTCICKSGRTGVNCTESMFIIVIPDIRQMNITLNYRLPVDD